jgi:hypothetical protein
MRITIALIVALLAFPAAALNEHGPWWDCIATYLSKQNDLITGHPDGPLALSAVVACRDLSARTTGEDLDTVKETIAHFRRLADMPGAPPAFRRPRQ